MDKCELQVQVSQLSPIAFNFDEVKEYVTAITKEYEGVVITEDDVKGAKKDRANLNKLKKEIEDKRKEVKAIINQPYADFEKKVKEIVAIVDEPINAIDNAVKEIEAKQKDEKRAEVEKVFAEIEFPIEVGLDQIFNEKWLNASTTMKDVEKDLIDKSFMIKQDLKIIEELPYAHEATEYYKKSLNLSAAMAQAKEAYEISKEKAPEEAVHEETVLDENETELIAAFRVKCSLPKLKALKAFLEKNNIHYEDLAL